MKNFRTNTTAVATTPVTGGRPARLRSDVMYLKDIF